MLWFSLLWQVIIPLLWKLRCFYKPHEIPSTLLFLGSYFHCFSLLLIAKSGEVSFTLQHVSKLAPFAQVLIYTLMPSGEVVADSRDYPVQRCLNNQVLTRQRSGSRGKFDVNLLAWTLPSFVLNCHQSLLADCCVAFFSRRWLWSFPPWSSFPPRGPRWVCRLTPAHCARSEPSTRASCCCRRSRSWLPLMYAALTRNILIFIPEATSGF